MKNGSTKRAKKENCTMIDLKIGKTYQVVLFYRYVNLQSVIQFMKEEFYCKCESLCLKGRILLADEGVNGTLAGSEEDVQEFCDYLVSFAEFKNTDLKFSTECGDKELPFDDLSVRIVKEIVSIGSNDLGKKLKKYLRYENESFGGLEGTGIHLSPSEFHNYLDDTENTIVFDVRNFYESDVGRFVGSRPLNTSTFCNSFAALDKELGLVTDIELQSETNMDMALNKKGEAICLNDDSMGENVEKKGSEISINDKFEDKKILMYCTGG